jgi:hypothetical protein
MMGDTIKTLKDAVDFVKSQSSYHKRQAERLTRRSENGNPELQRKLANHQRQSRLNDSLLEFISSGAHSIDEAAPIVRSGIVSASVHFLPEDLEDLPQELLDQLNINDSDKLELEIFDALKKAGGTLPVDKILIQLYRDTKQVHPREKLASKLYRMSSKGRLVASTEHRGVYSLPETTRITAVHSVVYDIVEDTEEQE